MTRNPTTETRTDATTETRTDRRHTTEQRYTDSENTGAAAVPDLRPDRDDRDDMDELVWSHRL